MRVSKTARRGVAVAMAGAATAVALALPASAATTSVPQYRPPVANVAPAKTRTPAQVRFDIAVDPKSVPAGARAILVKNVTTGAIIGVYTLNPNGVYHVTVTVPVGTTLDVSALREPNANKPANLGTVRLSGGGRESTITGNTVTITFKKNARPAAAPNQQLLRQGAKITVR